MEKLRYLIPSTLIVAALLVGCNDEYDDVAPGSWVDTERIETFPGDTVLISGTASNGSPITNVSLICEAWGISQEYERSTEDDNVFNYQYKLIVPEDATFNQTLTIAVKSENGKTTVREIPMSFLPDTQAPVASPSILSEVGLDFDTQAQKAVWNLEFTATDDRQLSKAVITIPGISYDKTVELTGRSCPIKESIEFGNVGSYPSVITIYDASGNVSTNNTTVMAMLAEVENPIQDYPGMYVVDANENPEDYIDGYYHWMD